MSEPISDAETRQADRDPPSGAETLGAASVQAPVDSLDRDRALHRVASSLFGGDAHAPRVAGYFLLEKLGAGAMGVVFAAYDPSLDRKVAIKILHRVGGEHGTEAHQQRLVREARSLAKLNHPNVVTVHAVGESERGAYVAMEYVEGTDLSEWMGLRTRDWRDVLDVFVAAGHGLSAAHQAGIVHRDFKPQNVLIGLDGGVRVADFGLARLEQATDPSDDGEQRTDPGSVSLTRTGGVVGTPLYMAPEQHLGETVEFAADQYAFCASLHEALHGTPPFPGRGLVALLESKLAAQPARPAQAGVPRWLSRVLDRGLSPKPVDRYESMDALLAAIDRGRRGGRAWLGLGVLGVAMLGIWVAYGSGDSAQTVDPCADTADRLSGVWDLATRDKAERAVLVTGESFAEHTWMSISGRLDAYSAQWIESREHACQAHQNGEESDELFDRRVECLESRRAQLRLVGEALASADAALVEGGLDLVASLPAVGDCAMPASLVTQRVRPDAPDDRKKGQQVLAKTQRVQTLFTLGRKEEASAELAKLESELEGLVDYGARAELLRLQSEFQPNMPSAIRVARLAVQDAHRSRDEVLILAAYEKLATHLNYDGHYDDALEELDVGMAILDRASATSQDDAWQVSLALLRAGFENLNGMVKSAQGNHRDALEHYERSLRLAEQYAELVPERRLVILNNYAEVLKKTARYEEAISHYEAALALAQGMYGVDHPNVARILGNRAATFVEMGRFEEGRVDIERVLVMTRAKLGERDPQVGLNEFNLALVEIGSGNIERADQLLSHVHEIFSESHGNPSAYIGIVESMQGTVARTRGDFPAAKALGAASVSMLRATLPGPHELLATGLSEQGISFFEANEIGAAERTLREALEVFAASVGTGTTTAAGTQATLAATLTRRGQYEEARRLFEEAERALAPYGQHPGRASALVLQADLLIETRENEAAISMLREALEIVESGSADPVLEAQAAGKLAGLVSDAEASSLRERATRLLAEQGERAERHRRELGL